MSSRSAIERLADAIFPYVAQQQGIIYRELFGRRLGRVLGRVAASYFRCRPPAQFVQAVKIGMLEDIDPRLSLLERLAIVERECQPFLRASFRRRWRRQQVKAFRREIRGSVPDEVLSQSRSPFVQSLLTGIISSRVADQLRWPRTLEEIGARQEALLREFLASGEVADLLPPDILDQRVRRQVLADLTDAEPELVDRGATAYEQIMKSTIWMMAQGALRGVLTEKNLRFVAGELGMPYQNPDALLTWVTEVSKRPREEQEALAKQMLEHLLRYVVPKVLGIHYRQDAPLGEEPGTDAGVEPAEFALLASQIETQLHTELQKRAFRAMCFQAQHGAKFAEAARQLGESDADIAKLRSTKNRLLKLLRRLLK